LIDHVALPVCSAVARVSRVKRGFLVEIFRKFFAKIAEYFRRGERGNRLRMKLVVNQFFGLAFHRLEELLSSFERMLLAEDKALFFVSTNVFRGVRIQGLRHLVDRFSKFLYCGLKLKVLLLQQRGDLFSGVGAAREHCFHDNTRVLNDMLSCIVEQYRFARCNQPHRGRARGTG
jgi:hypothetical protein